MAENPIDVPQMNSSNQENEEASLVCPSDNGLVQSDHDTIHSDLLSCSVPQERFVHQLLDGNGDSSEKFEVGISQNQEFGESKSIYVPQERFVHQPVGNAESLAEFEKGINQNREIGECKNVSVLQERSVLHPVDGNAESLAKFEMGIDRNQEIGECKNASVRQERSVLQPIDVYAESMAKSEEGINRNQKLGESKNIFCNDVRQCGWKIDVIDDTAVIETGIGGVIEEEFAGFASYHERSSSNQVKKQEMYGINMNSWQKVRKGSRNGSRTSGNEKGMTCLGENQSMHKMVHQRRSVFLDEQTKKVHFGSRKWSRANENRSVLTRKLAGQNMGHKNYSMKNKEEGQCSSNVEEQVKNIKTDKVYYVWRKCSRTNGNEKKFTHKFDDQNLFEKREKWPKRVHYIECSKADSNKNVLRNKSDRSKMVYTRNEMEAMRFIGVEEQKKTWAEVYYCGLTPEVMREYNGLVATSLGKHTHVNFIPKHSILGSFAVKR